MSSVTKGLGALGFGALRLACFRVWVLRGWDCRVLGFRVGLRFRVWGF